MTGQSYQAKILDKVIELAEGQATIVERVDNIDEKLDAHLEECRKNGQRRKDEKGKYVERRSGKWRNILTTIAITVSIISMLGGWTFVKCSADSINKTIQDYDKYKSSRSE